MRNAEELRHYREAAREYLYVTNETVREWIDEMQAMINRQDAYIKLLEANSNE